MNAQPSYVSAFLRDADRDRYFATLLLSPPERDAIQALYAFNADGRRHPRPGPASPPPARSACNGGSMR